MSPNIIKGNSHTDARGTLVFNNNYDATEVKRIYFIENSAVDFVRGWQGHQIEQRWFSVVEGSFKICTRAIDNWENPSKELPFESFTLSAATFDVLHVPKRYITSIQSLEKNSRLMAMSDYSLGAVSDEYRFDINYFNN
jgi:dTDP-4-dehydrorhamnose 3,5-epimerase-like enzyme